ncbi:hypothetical protein KSP40_PGU012989 [Platanthera guangdongensis]|uniref:3'-5' exonuclease domain-containing protein n=1 Tax=Platanthera guangdongensis TaxID=2320717 RepID=A0ABR2MZW1_9ASPA
MELITPNPRRLPEIFIVTSPDSPEFSRLRSAIRHSSVVALDAEWKPIRSRQVADSSDEAGGSPSFPTVTLLQIACRLYCEDSDLECSVVGSCPVFLVDLVSLPLSTVWELLREMFVSPSVLKLGFRFKQDFVYLSSTFSSQGCFLGFDEVICCSYLFSSIFLFAQTPASCYCPLTLEISVLLNVQLLF